MRRLRICVLLLVPFGIVCAQSFEETAQRAVQFQQAGDYKSAAAAYREALAVRPEDVAARVNLGVVLVADGRFDEGIAAYRKAEKLLPGDPRIELNIALAYQKSGRQQQARDILEKLHTGQPQEPRFAMLLADSELQLGNDGHVIELLEPLAGNNNEDLAIAYMLGMAYLHSGRTEAAQNQLDRILRNGDTAEAHFLLGTRAFESRDYPEAVKELGRAAELKPALPQLQSLYGQVLLETGDADGAAAAFRKELSGNGSDYRANLGLAEILIARKAFADARPFLEGALTVHSDSPEARLSMAECLAGLGEFQKALPAAEELAKLIPKSAEVHETLAEIYTGLHRDAAAKRERDAERRIEADADPGPAVGSAAPEFELADAQTGAAVRLRGVHAKEPAVLVFGSYTCPNFRGSAEALKSLCQRYRGRAAFLLIYIREAHATDNWQSTRNQGEGVALAPAATYADKQEHAAMCSRKLHLNFPAVVDGMDGAVEKAYNAWPSRVFVIGEDGRVRYSSRLTELAFRAEEMEAALRQAMR